MTDNTTEPALPATMNDLMAQVDFKKLGQNIGMPDLGMIESAKIFQAQLEYQQKLFDMMFEMNSEFYIRWFGKEKYAVIYKQHFPKGRQYYLNLIAQADKAMQDIQNKVASMVAQVTTQSPPQPEPAKKE